MDYPAGVCLVPNAYLLHHDPDVYADPYAFRPERFLDEGPGTYTWIPFGGGRRRCLGASFAMVEMKLVLRTVLGGCELRAGGAHGAAAAAQHHDPARRRWRAPCWGPEPGARVGVSGPRLCSGAGNGHDLRMRGVRAQPDLVDAHGAGAWPGRAGWRTRSAGWWCSWPSAS